jgi:SNF2 family DNA or RNA helicase
MLRRFYSWQLPMFTYTGKWDDPALLTDMRTGKALVSIRRVKNYSTFENSLNLIVSPVSAIYDWMQDLEREELFDYVLLIGKREKRLQLLEEKHNWYIINTEGWQWIPEICEIPWNSLIFDESTAIMNPKSKITKFFCKYFRNVPHRYILTGTPNPESALNYFCQFLFLDGGETLGENFYRFRAKHFQPDYFGNKWKPTPSGIKFITEAIGKRAFLLKRKDIKGIKGFKEYRTGLLELPADLQETYRTVEEEFILEFDETFLKTKYGVAKYNWLRQLTSGLVDGKVVWNGKIDYLIELLTGELKGEQVVIFAEFTEEINAIYAALEAVKIKTVIVSGKVSKTDRINTIGLFQAGKIPVLIGQNLAVTYGTNLSVATAGIYYSRPLRSLVRSQTEERIVTAMKEEISLIFDIIVADTVDFDLYESLKNKVVDSAITYDIAKKISQRINLKERVLTV